MGNINFSADMVGIQTLAQQGMPETPQDSVLAEMGGSFEDLILQMISNNLTVDETPMSPFVGSAYSLLGQTEENGEKENNNKTLYNLLSPELILQIAQMYNIQPSQYADFVQQLSLTPVGFTDSIAVTAPFEAVQLKAADIADTVKEYINTTKDVVVPNEDINAEIFNTNNAETAVKITDGIVSDKAQTYAADGNAVETELVKNVVKTADSDVRTENDVSDTPYKVIARKIPVADTKGTQSNVDANTDNSQEMSFISTSDMLSMRGAVKTELPDSSVPFKVANAPVNIEAPDAAEKLAEKIIMKLGDNKFEVELYPKHLGKIEVSLVIKDGIVNVAMSGSNARVNEFLASQSANVQSIVEKNTQYETVVKVDNSQNQYSQQQRDNTQQSADDSQRERQKEHIYNLYQQNNANVSTADFLSMLRLV